MGQKVHPLALRLGYTKNWRSLWFAQRREFSDNIKQDFKIRAYIREKFEQAAVSMIVIERLAEQVKVRIHTARPGVIIGRRGADIDRLRAELKDHHQEGHGQDRHRYPGDQEPQSAMRN